MIAKPSSRSVEGRFPENLILSHDLLEGCYARTGLVSDVQVFEEYPASYLADSRRRHRWIRGDWQIVPWLLSSVPDNSSKKQRNPLSLLSRWKIFDNLRRSLVAPATFLLLLIAWTGLYRSSLLDRLYRIAVPDSTDNYYRLENYKKARRTDLDAASP